mgnify:FL=1
MSLTAEFFHLNLSRYLLTATILLLAPQLFAHNSTAEVETDIQKRERYLELSHQPAPEFSLLDSAGNEVRLKDFRGKAVVLNFIYSRCQEACPLHSFKLAELQKLIAEASLPEAVQFISIATDTEDAMSTAASMRKHAASYGLDSENWIFLYGGNGREELGRGMALGYGLKFEPTGTGEQMHAVVTYLIDRNGLLRARYHGLNFVSVNLAIHAAALANDVHSETEKLHIKPGNTTFSNYAIALLAIFSSLGLLYAIAMLYRRYRNPTNSSPSLREAEKK